MSKTALPGDEEKFELVPPMQPESEVDAAGYFGSSEWFRDLDGATKAALHREQGSRLSGPLAIQPPAVKSRFRDEPQPGCLEWIELESEQMRFRTLLLGRDPTPEEIAEH